MKNKQNQPKRPKRIRKAKDLQFYLAPNVPNRPLPEGFPPPECTIQEDPIIVSTPPAKFEPISEPETVSYVRGICTFCSTDYQKDQPISSQSNLSFNDEYRHQRMEYVLAKEIDPAKASECCDRCWKAFDAFCDFKRCCDVALMADKSSESAENNSLIVNTSEPRQEQVCSDHDTDTLLEDVMRKQYGCDICGKRYQSQGSLTSHAVRHRDPQFPCGTCGKAFYYRCALRAHYRAHSDEMNFQCMECGKFFKYERSHRIHQRIHTGENQFVCHVCNQRFAYKKSLTQHATKCKLLDVTSYDEIGGLAFLL